MATSVSLRKGTRDEHRRFKGDLGEVTFCTDENPTLFIHLGDEKEGSPLAREDMENVDGENIAKRGIAKLDLTNVTIPSAQIETVKGNLNGLNYAQRDMSDVTTLNLIENGAHQGPDLARADSLTTFTTQLAEGTENDRDPEIYGKNLAYKDMTNVSTETVVGKLTVNNNHLYADRDLGNVDTTNLATGQGHAGLNLAYANLSNLEVLSSSTLNKAYQYGLQLTSNLTQNIDTGTNSEYPSAAAVRTKFESLSRLPDFNQLGTEDYQVLITSFTYGYFATLAAPGDGYQINDILTLVDSNNSSLGVTINVLDVTDPDDQPSGINSFELQTTYGNVQISGTYNTMVNLTPFELVPQISAQQLNKIYTITDEFTTTSDFIIGAGTHEPAFTKIQCVNTAAEGQTPVYKWKIVTTASGARFTMSSNATGVVPGPNSQISWINLKSPITIRDVQMMDEDGYITVVFSRNPSYVQIKKLIGGEEILGTWSPLGITMSFTPDIPSDVLLDSWVIKVDG